MRRERRLILAEGEDVVDAALAHGIRPQALLVDQERVPDDDPRLVATADMAERYRVPGRLMAGASTLAAPPRIMAILPQPPLRSFRDVRFPPGALVGAIVRGSGHVVVPRGEERIAGGDRVILFALEKVVPQLEAAFLATTGRR